MVADCQRYGSILLNFKPIDVVMMAKMLHFARQRDRVADSSAYVNIAANYVRNIVACVFSNGCIIVIS